MKKLLLVLICLFVSFEVRSESDDLSGKKLLCIDNKEKLSEGYEFINEEEVIRYSFPLTVLKGKDGVASKVSNVLVLKGKYGTNILKIGVRFLGTGLYSATPIIENQIDRQELRLDYSYPTDLEYGQCRKFEGNVESYYNNLREKTLRELKSKQKI